MALQDNKRRGPQRNMLKPPYAEIRSKKAVTCGISYETHGSPEDNSGGTCN